MALTPIVFYDIPSEKIKKPWSPNTWKTRYALNVKGLPYRTEWVEYPDIEALAKKIGAAPTATKPDGSPFYTVPMINDPNTGKVVSDSFRIAEYLDATYPNEKVLFPPGTRPLIASFESSIVGALNGVFMLQLAVTFSVLNHTSQVYFRRTREALFSKKIEEFSPEATRAADIAKGRTGFAVVDGWVAKSEGKFLLGDNISYADVILAAWLTWIRNTNGIWLNEFETWHNGRWTTYLQNIENAGYANDVN